MLRERYEALRNITEVLLRCQGPKSKVPKHNFGPLQSSEQHADGRT